MGEPTAEAEDEALHGGPAVDAATLWADFGPPLRRFLARRVPPGLEADDLLQDVFVRVVRKLGSLRDTGRPEAWLYQIARNALRDALRLRARRDERTDAVDGDLPDGHDAVDQRQAESELAPCLTGMVGRLTEPYRTAITLTSLQGVTQADAARLTGISVSGMKSRVQRGREQLRHMLVDCCAVALDVRGGVSDFHPRERGSCGARSNTEAGAAPATGGCCATRTGKH
jgi:RNA polymerase sigma-70 factor (ECF subfamily)